jgi:hypothetical protein
LIQNQVIHRENAPPAMDLTSLRPSRHSRRLLMLRRKRYGAERIAVRVAQSLILRRRRNLQRAQSQGDTRNHPMSSALSSAAQKTISKETSNDLARPLHTSCAGTRRRSTPIRPRTSRFALRRRSEANSCAWRPYPPRDIAGHRHRHRRRRTSRVVAVLCGSSENSRDIDRRPEWARAPRIPTTVQRVVAPSAAESLDLSVTTAGERRFARGSASTGSECAGRPTIDGSAGCEPPRCSTTTWWHCNASHWEAPHEVYPGQRQDPMSEDILHALL